MRRIRVLIIVGTALSILVVLFFHYKWSRLEYYLPSEQIRFSDSFRTMAEHSAIMEGREWPYILKLGDDGDSALLYFGSRHTTNPDDPQIAEIQKLWHEFKPTVTVTENRLGFFVGGLRAGISMFAEFGLVNLLATDSDIPIYTLEPPWEVEVEEMKTTFPTAEVTLFYTLRVFLYERGDGKSKEDIDALASHLLEKRGSRPGLEHSLPDLAALDHLWQEKFSQFGDWRELPEEVLWPSAEPTPLQAMANQANEVRDRHAAAVILDLLAKGERVFALAGGSHVVVQEPVLRAGFSGTVVSK